MANVRLDADVSASEAARGLKVGIVSFVVGLLAATLLVDSDDGDELFEDSAGVGTDTLTYGQIEASRMSPPSDFKLAGWLFHKSHFASIDVSLTTGSSDLAFAMNPPGLLLLVPIALLTGAGFYLARRGEQTDLRGAATTGALVVIGYLPWRTSRRTCSTTEASTTRSGTAS